MAAIIVVVALDGTDTWKRVPVKEEECVKDSSRNLFGVSALFCTCRSWEAFLAKISGKFGVENISKITAESDGAEIEDIEELMSGDRLIVHVTDSASSPLDRPASMQDHAATSSSQATQHTAEASGQAGSVVSSALHAEVDRLAAKLRTRNAASDVGACLSLIQKLASNAERPESKFRSIRLTIPKIAASLSRHPAAIQLLQVLGFEPSRCALDSDATSPVDADKLAELQLEHEFLVLPHGESLKLSTSELELVLTPHIQWAQARTSTVSGSAGYAAVKSQLAQVRKEYGKDDVSQVPSSERYKLYPVYMAAEAAFKRRQASAAPVARCPEVFQDPHMRSAGPSDDDSSPSDEQGDASSGAGGAASGGDFTEDDIVTELGGKDGLAGAQALLAAAGGATSKSMAQYVVFACSPQLRISSLLVCLQSQESGR